MSKKARKVRLMPLREAWASQFGKSTIKGTPIAVAEIIGTRYGDEIVRYVDRMVRETRRALREYEEQYVEDSAMDANAGSGAKMIFNALEKKFAEIFARVAPVLAQKMVGQTERNNAATLGASLKELSGGMTLRTDIVGGELKDVLTASINANVDLIKRVPEKFFDQMKGEVFRSIQNGAQNDLTAALDKYGVQTRNWAKNVAMDQTRKAYAGIAKGRMEALGLDEFEWIHSGGSQHPREYHRDELNGNIYKLSEPPIIDKKSGERGLPGTAPYCRCIMRPVFRFQKDDDEE